MMKLQEKFKNFGVEKTLKTIKRLSPKDFDEKVWDKNIYNFLGMSEDEFDELEYQFKDIWVFHKVVNKILPVAYKDCDWAISHEGIFEWN